MRKRKRTIQNTLFFSILGRILVFLNSMGFIFLFFYFLGNYQLFLDSTQLFLLQCLEYTVLLAGMLGAYYIAVLIIMTVKNKKTYFIRFFLTVISIFINFTLFLGLKFMFSWFQM